MKLSAAVLSALVLSATASHAQIGFTTNTYPATATDIRLRVADFNGDGKPDLLGDAGHVYLNNGSGGFNPPVALPYSQPNAPFVDVKVADMNGDGSPDIVACTGSTTANPPNNFFVAIFLNDGHGNFTLGQNTRLPYPCSTLAVGDVNHDGHPDVVAAGYDDPTSTAPVNYFQTLFGDGKGNVGAPVVMANVNLGAPSKSPNYTNCEVIDITGGNFYLDGQFSLIVNAYCLPTQNSLANPGTTFIAHGQGNGQFTFTLSAQRNEYLTDGQTVDVNQDGIPDATFFSVTRLPYANLYYAQNNGNGNFTYNQLTSRLSQSSHINNFTGVAVGDFNLDGVNDIASIFETNPVNAPSQAYISILDGSKSGTFTESQSWLVNPDSVLSRDIVAADFNGDGKTDLAAIVIGNFAPPTLYVYTNTMAGPGVCSAPAQANTNVICTPARSSSNSSPVTVTAASNVGSLTLNRLYLDNTSVYQTTSQSINTPITAAVGSHSLTLVSYNIQGQAFTSSTTFTVGAASCPPSTPGINVCQPTQGSSINSPVTITAGALAQSGYITAIRYYIDNVPVYTATNPSNSTSFQATQAIPLNDGGHHLVAVAYQSAGPALTFAEDFTVALNFNCAPSTPGALICSPAPNSTVMDGISYVRVSAGATAASGYITAIAIYLDNAQLAVINNPTHSQSFPITQPIYAASGTHHLVVVGYQSTGGAVTAGEYFTEP